MRTWSSIEDFAKLTTTWLRSVHSSRVHIVRCEFTLEDEDMSNYHVAKPKYLYSKYVLYD